MGENEVALAARALAAKSGTAAVAERDEVGDTDVIDTSEALVRGRDSSTSAPGSHTSLCSAAPSVSGFWCCL